MMKWKMAAYVLAVAGLLAGCEKADRRYGHKDAERYTVTLYAEGQAVRSWLTDGAVHVPIRGEGVSFVVDGQLVTVTGAVVVERARDELSNPVE